MMLGMGLTLHSMPLIGGTVPDPLEGVVFAYGRLQTHRGDNVPLGLYQDEACTIPAVNAYDPVAVWRDELTESGVVATQSNPDKQGYLDFINEVPFVILDGVDDCYQHGMGAASPGSIFAVGKHTSSLAYRMIASFGASGGPHLYSCLGPDPEWGGYYGANVKASSSLTSIKVAATIVRAPNDVDFYTNDDLVTRTNGAAYDGSAGNFIGSEAGGTAAFHVGPIGAVLAGPVTNYDHAAIRSYLASIFAPALGL